MIQRIRVRMLEKPVWLLDEALTLIRSHETRFREFGYFSGLTGGVLYKGYSDHDLDIMLMPLNREVDYRLSSLLTVMQNVWEWGHSQVMERREVSPILVKFPEVAIDLFIVTS